jgi:hypothetical protein
MNNQRIPKRINHRKYDSDDDSDNSDDDSEFYQKALMTSLIAMSNKSNTVNLRQNSATQSAPASTSVSNMRSISQSHNSEGSDLKPTESRIEFIKNILKGCELKPMVDYDSCDTESLRSTKLNKKVIDVKKLFTSMDVKLIYLKSGANGHTFKAVSTIDKNVAFAVKVVAYPKEESYGGINKMDRPENAELRMIKLLSYFVVNRITPHIVLPVATFNTSITDFIRIPENIINLKDEKNDMYRKFVEKYHEHEFEDLVSVLVSEWCKGGDLLDYIRKNYQIMKLETWRNIFFQLLYTLSQIHKKYPKFRHNDLKANNVLVQLTDIKCANQNCSQYRYNTENYGFVVPNINLQIQIWDFDFACIDGVINNAKVNSDWTHKINITSKENKYYDMHYFFNTLINKRFFPQFYEEGAVPQEIIEFIHRVIPLKFRNGGKFVNKKGRIQVDTEYTTPLRTICEDPLFKKYRKKLPAQ